MSTPILTAEQYDQHCLGAIINLRVLMRILRLPSTSLTLDAIQRHTRSSVECDLCWGTRAFEKGDRDYRECHGCRDIHGLPQGIDRSAPVGRIYDRRAPLGRKLSCPVCLQQVQSDAACDHCGQVFIREDAEDGTPSPLEVLLQRSVERLAKEAA